VYSYASSLSKDDLRKMQRSPIDKGYDLGGSGADGVMGGKTKAALSQFYNDQYMASLYNRLLAQDKRPVGNGRQIYAQMLVNMNPDYGGLWRSMFPKRDTKTNPDEMVQGQEVLDDPRFWYGTSPSAGVPLYNADLVRPAINFYNDMNSWLTAGLSAVEWAVKAGVANMNPYHRRDADGLPIITYAPRLHPTFTRNDMNRALSMLPDLSPTSNPKDTAFGYRNTWDAPENGLTGEDSAIIGFMELAGLDDTRISKLLKQRGRYGLGSFLYRTDDEGIHISNSYKFTKDQTNPTGNKAYDLIRKVMPRAQNDAKDVFTIPWDRYYRVQRRSRGKDQGAGGSR